MGNSGKGKPFSLAVVFLPIILYGIPLSIFLLRRASNLWEANKPPLPRPLSPEEATAVVDITEILLSRGIYTAAIPDIISKLLQHYSAPVPPGPLTVFVPWDDTEYEWCKTERPGPRFVTARVDRESFGPGRLTNGSILPSLGGDRSAIWVEESPEGDGDLSAGIEDWSLYDDGRVAVHGFFGAFYPYRSVAAVGSFAISGLIEKKRGPPKSICPRLPPGMTDLRVRRKMDIEAYRREYVRRVDGLPVVTPSSRLIVRHQ